MLIRLQIELFYPFSLLILRNGLVKIFKLTLVKILLCLLNREYHIEQIPVKFLVAFSKNAGRFCGYKLLINE